MIDAREWLEADGLGGFAMGSADGLRRRRYHGLLLTATRPPTGRVMLVNGVEAWFENDTERVPLSTHRYAPDIFHPNGFAFLADFTADPWPRWTFALPAGGRIVHELVVPHGASRAILTWRLEDGASGRLTVRPLLSGRDYHALHRENPTFSFESHVRGAAVTWRPYESLPAIVARSNGLYRADAAWFRNFVYETDRDRGLDFMEDLGSPGVFEWTLAPATEAALDLGAAGFSDPDRTDVTESVPRAKKDAFKRRGRFSDPLRRSADAYLVRRGGGVSIVAGYPWFTDWARDTFISLRGLCIAGGARLEDAEKILLEWSSLLENGLFPNFFPDGVERPSYNAADAPLWYVAAVEDLVTQSLLSRRPVGARRRAHLERTVDAILDKYQSGTDFGVRADDDGLLWAGQSDSNVTWMDAQVDGRAVTPRWGKPVEIQALWLSALRFAGARRPAFAALFDKGRESFARRFWNSSDDCLFDVVDMEGRAGFVDRSIRPNQVLAVGGLPASLLDRDRARRLLDTVERELLTPVGLRTLSPRDHAYRGRYAGGPAERDAGYHQGAVWPWLLGPFVEAWVRVRGRSVEARRQARDRFLPPLRALLEQGAFGHLPELLDGDAPHRLGGAPCQAWSLAELMRLEQGVLAPD